MSDTRPVWLTREKALVHGLGDRWERAPTDAVEAATIAAKPWDIVEMGDGYPSAVGLEGAEIARRVLLALGYPGE